MDHREEAKLLIAEIDELIADIDQAIKATSSNRVATVRPALRPRKNPECIIDMMRSV